YSICQCLNPPARRSFSIISVSISYTYIPPFPLFFFTVPAPTEIYTLSLHDALPILEDVLEVYHRPHDPGRPVVCLDEYSKQLIRSEEHTSELQSRSDLVCRLLLEKKK